MQLKKIASALALTIMSPTFTKILHEKIKT